MEKIASFTIDHIKLQPGVYVSRKDHVGAEVITTFDLRMTSPNDEPVMNTAEVHTIEHLLPSCGITRTFLIRPSTSDRWDAAPASIFSLLGITSRRTSFR
jgi:S-ribosylhomocysteine lyase LuxS involved in autoinducer biosynthesis